jgi:hypothetical protein
MIEKVAHPAKQVHKIPLGTVEATIWLHNVETGPRHVVTVRKLLYNDGTGWKGTNTFARDDLLLLAKVADLAHTWIHDQSPSPLTD